ncbi:hypothetical protein KP509_18G056100 [Ceratopteris richardii]|uniref:Uncharacterized protein n=1 Tax=Ceratopteris richardii TaxID=49495 RepID=A0A8T2SUC8_CERRI|nr:hypothetical protein KP509_18G056100 [Ceratopteris richardii]
MACQKQQSGLPCNGVVDPEFGHFILDHSEKRKKTKSVIYPLEKSREVLTEGMIYPQVMAVGPETIHTYKLRTLKWSSKPRETVPGAQVVGACPAMQGKLLLKLSKPYHGQTICFFSLETSTIQGISPCLSIDAVDLLSAGYCNGVVIAIGKERGTTNSVIVEYYMNKQWKFLYRFNSDVQTTVYSDIMTRLGGSLYAGCADNKKQGFLLRVKCDCDPKDDKSIPIEWSLLSLPETAHKQAQQRQPCPSCKPTVAVVACEDNLYCIQSYEEVYYLYKVFVEGPFREEKQRISYIYDPDVASSLPPLKGFKRVIGLGNLILLQLQNGEMWTYRMPDQPWPAVQTFQAVKALPNSSEWAICAWDPSSAS